MSNSQYTRIMAQIRKMNSDELKDKFVEALVRLDKAYRDIDALKNSLSERQTLCNRMTTRLAEIHEQLSALHLSRADATDYLLSNGLCEDDINNDPVAALIELHRASVHETVIS